MGILDQSGGSLIRRPKGRLSHLFSVSPEIYGILFLLSRWLFVILAAVILLSALGWLAADRHARKEMLRSLPGAGTVGELIVLSGSEHLPAQTWFPVPREGVLGSVRSCDLVVPGSGIRSCHLDFRWQDGVGLLLYPRSGCQVLVDGMPLDCRSDAFSRPMTHGMCLQVGEVILQLQLFAAMDHTVRPPQPAMPAETPAPPAGMPWPVQDPGFRPIPDAMQYPPAGSMPYPPAGPTAPAGIPADPVVPAQSPAPDKQWKEDWSE